MVWLARQEMRSSGQLEVKTGVEQMIHNFEYKI
jgi:hypothetical protein